MKPWVRPCLRLPATCPPEDTELLPVVDVAATGEVLYVLSVVDCRVVDSNRFCVHVLSLLVSPYCVCIVLQSPQWARMSDECVQGCEYTYRSVRACC
jgi:hypothetical protein